MAPLTRLDSSSILTISTQQRASSASRPPLSPVARSSIPLYARPPLGSNVDTRPPVHDQSRPVPPYQQRQQPGSSNGAEYAPHNGPQTSLHERDYTRHPGPPAGPPRMPNEYSTPVGADRQQPRWIQQSPYPHASNNHAVDGRPRPPVVPSQQRILPSTPISVEQQRVIDPSPTTTAGGVSAYPRLQFRNMDEFPANSQKAKRKGDAHDDGQAQQQPSPKRARSLGAHGSDDKARATPGDQSHGDAEGDNVPAPTVRPVVKRTIDFNEVYQDGDAEYKHVIVQYPQGDSGGNWYILKCDTHGVHFNCNPLHGAAKHLHSNQHNHMSKEHALAIRELGHLVWDCNKELAEKNNAAVKEAFAKGYKPFNRNQLSKTERRSMGFADPETPSARKTQPGAAGQRKKDKVGAESAQHAGSKEFAGVAYPVDGELYLAYWSKTKTRYAVILLPWGDLKPSTGMQGTLLGTGLLEKPPKCYTIDRVTREITGWAEGYEDGGRLVTKRDFPVMYFDNPQRGSVGWVHAKDLSLFNFDDPDWRSIPFYLEARDRYAAAQPQKFGSYREMKQYCEANGHPVKLLSDVRDPPATETPPMHSAPSKGAMDAVDNGDGPETNGRKSPGRPGPELANGHGAPADVEMRDVSKADDIQSDHESEPSHEPDSDEDVEMGNVESRRTSVSNKGSGGSDVPSTAATTEKETAAPLEADGDAVAAEVNAATATKGSPANNQGGESGAQDKDRDLGHAAVRTKEDAALLQNEAETAGGVTHGNNIGASTRRGPSPVTGATSWRVMNATAQGVGSARSSEGPSGTASTATNGGGVSSPSSPQTADDQVAQEAQASAKTPTGGHEIRANPIPRVPKASGQPEPKEAASLATADGDGATLSNEHPLKNAEALQVTAAAPPTSQVSDSSSVTSSPPSLRSTSPMPTPVAAAVSHPSSSSRTPTPSILRPEDTTSSNRWRAVRSESIPQAAALTPTQPPANASLATPSANPAAKQAAAKDSSAPAVVVATAPAISSRTSTPVPSKTGGEELFEIAYYEDSAGGKFQKQKGGPFLRIVVDKVANACETPPGQPLEVKINPQEITQVQVDPLDDSGRGPCMVTLQLRGDVGGPKKQQLVFETSKAMGREEAGRIHARRFCGWVKRVNAGIDYRNNT